MELFQPKVPDVRTLLVRITRLPNGRAHQREFELISTIYLTDEGCNWARYERDLGDYEGLMPLGLKIVQLVEKMVPLPECHVSNDSCLIGSGKKGFEWEVFTFALIGLLQDETDHAIALELEGWPDNVQQPLAAAA